VYFKVQCMSWVLKMYDSNMHGERIKIIILRCSLILIHYKRIMILLACIDSKL